MIISSDGNIVNSGFKGNNNIPQSFHTGGKAPFSSLIYYKFFLISSVTFYVKGVKHRLIVHK